MPFTPFHMGPGVFVKALLQGSFSLMVFGYTQIIMDLQPLFVMVSGDGHLHGFSHTFVGATLIALFSALSGKYLSEFGLKIIYRREERVFKITWLVAVISAFIGSYSHVLLDGIMHSDVEPFFPLNKVNPLLGIVSISTLHTLCLASGIVGGVMFYVISWVHTRRKK